MARDIGSGSRRPRVDDVGGAHDLDGFVDRADLELERKVDGLAERHDNARAHRGLEPLQFGLDAVRGRRQERNCVPAFGICHDGLHALWTGDGHGRARNGELLSIDDSTGDGSRCLLAKRGSRDGKAKQC